MYILCNKCHHGIRVRGGDPNDIELMFKEGEYTFVCYHCESKEVVAGPAVDGDLQGWFIIELSAQEAHLAMVGMGIPEERECAMEIVRGILTSQPVKEVKARTIPNTGRSAIDYIMMEDGTTLFLCASTHGAQVYRIRKPHSYVKEMGNG